MEVYTLPLSENGEPIPSGKGQFIKLPQPDAKNPYILRFVVFSASEIVNKGVLHCNVPPPGTEFQRFKYYTYPISANFHEETHIDVTISAPGAYSYFITYIPVTDPYFNPEYVDLSLDDLNIDESSSSSDQSTPSLQAEHSSTSLYPLAESPYASSTNIPALSTADRLLAVQAQDKSDAVSLQEDPKDRPHNDLVEDYARSCTPKYYFIVSAGFVMDLKPLSLNALNIESVISKWMGPVNTWENKLTLIKEKGYNMIHFTPLQQRGSSNSPYSIYDQLAFDKECFPHGEKDINALVSMMEHKIHLLSLTDVVYNHTAHNSDWLKDHPEAGYSAKTAPHLTPAIELDSALLEFSANLKVLGYPTMINSVNDLNRIMDGIKEHVIGPVKLWEFYVVNVSQVRDEAIDKWNSVKDDLELVDPIPVPAEKMSNLSELAAFTVENAAVDYHKFGHARYIKSLDPEKFVAILYSVLLSAKGKAISVNDIAEKATAILNEINLSLYREYDTDVSDILLQLFNRIKYTRLDSYGPRMGEITGTNPLIETYFTRVRTRPTGEVVALANNGWIWNGNPLVDFASSKSKAYLRREVIIWGDCVKLRYGSHPSDSPYLWDRMTKYTELMAKYFHGFRIDNCHSTPLHVGEYMLDKARLVRNNLYVVAELFTGSEDMDRIFVERLGITSLIREAMQAWSVEELSRLVHRHGGRPIGSFSRQPFYTYEKFASDTPRCSLVQSSNIHALFMDCTHDNESPAQKRTVEDTLPNAALVAMCACAVGSVMGYDEGYPKLLEIVTESRQYTFGGGIGKIKKLLYDVHSQMGQDEADEMHVHHEGQYITVHRVNPRTGEGWFLIARTKFGEEGDQRRKYTHFHHSPSAVLTNQLMTFISKEQRLFV